MNDSLLRLAGLSNDEAHEADLIIVDGVIVKDRHGYLNHDKKVIIRTTPHADHVMRDKAMDAAWAAWGLRPRHYRWLRNRYPKLVLALDEIKRLVEEQMAAELAYTRRRAGK